MPAVTFMKSTTHSSQNCVVRIACDALNVAPHDPARRSAGVQPAGCQPSRGTRTVSTPNIMNAKYKIPITTNVGATPCGAVDLKCAMSDVASGEPIIAPPPNPMIASPVAIPGRSGNHLISVDTGEM